MHAQQHPLEVGDPAPDLTLEDGSGHEQQLGKLWAVRPLLLAFLRHYG
jgi:peroxiredoxin